jgi:hypothetical protein
MIQFTTWCVNFRKNNAFVYLITFELSSQQFANSQITKNNLWRAAEDTVKPFKATYYTTN